MIKYEDIERVNKEIVPMALTQKKKDKFGNWEEVTEDYATVKERIIAFRKLFPMGVITTDVNMTDKFVTCKTEVYDGSGNLLANGHARESVEKRNPLETCETSSVGRALGMLGIGIQTSLSSAEDIDSYNKEQIFDEKPLGPFKQDLAMEFNNLYTVKEKADILNGLMVKYPEDLELDTLKNLVERKKYGQKQNTAK